jgi:hypothetical protein
MKNGPLDLGYSGITWRLISTPKLLKLKRNKSLRAGLIVPARFESYSPSDISPLHPSPLLFA